MSLGSKSGRLKGLLAESLLMDEVIREVQRRRS